MSEGRQTIRLNLRAVKALLPSYNGGNHSELTDTDKQLLQRRFDAYCRIGHADFNVGAGNGNLTAATDATPPTIDNLPSKTAIQAALLTR